MTLKKLLIVSFLCIFVSLMGFTLVANADITSGLIAHWMFDETSGLTAEDTSSNGHDGNLVNGPVWSTGKVDGGLTFDGVNDYVDAGNIGLTAGTVSMWINSIVCCAFGCPYPGIMPFTAISPSGLIKMPGQLPLDNVAMDFSINFF